MEPFLAVPLAKATHLGTAGERYNQGKQADEKREEEGDTKGERGRAGLMKREKEREEEVQGQEIVRVRARL